MTHYVKIWPKFYDEVAGGMKTAQLRKNDRNFQVKERICMQEYDPEMKIYTGRTVTATITDKIEKCEGLVDGFCILSIKLGPDCIRWDTELVGKAG